MILFHCEGEATPTRSLRPLPGLWLAARRLAGGELEGVSAVDFRGANPFVPSGPLGCRTTCLEMETYKQTNHWTRIQIRLAAQNHITVASSSTHWRRKTSFPSPTLKGWGGGGVGVWRQFNLKALPMTVCVRMCVASCKMCVCVCVEIIPRS